MTTRFHRTDAHPPRVPHGSYAGDRHLVLEPAASARVRLELDVTHCTIVDVRGSRLVEPGDIDVLVGPSSRDEKLLTARFTVR